jgi:hypothetical protein
MVGQRSEPDEMTEEIEEKNDNSPNLLGLVSGESWISETSIEAARSPQKRVNACDLADLA